MPAATPPSFDGGEQLRVGLARALAQSAYHADGRAVRALDAITRTRLLGGVKRIHAQSGKRSCSSLTISMRRCAWRSDRYQREGQWCSSGRRSRPSEPRDQFVADLAARTMSSAD